MKLKAPKRTPHEKKKIKEIRDKNSRLQSPKPIDKQVEEEEVQNFDQNNLVETDNSSALKRPIANIQIIH